MLVKLPRASHVVVLALLISCSPGMGEPDAGSGGGSAGTGGQGGSAGGSAGSNGGGSTGGGSAGGAAAGGSGGGSAGGSAMVGKPMVYVGSGSTLYFYDLNLEDAGLKLKGQIAAGAGSGFLAMHPSKRFLYAVNEGSSEVASFAIDAGTGGLTFLNRVSSGPGSGGPAHLSVEPSGRFVLVANYGGGTVAVLPIRDGGSLGTYVDSESPGANAHQIITDPGGTNVYVPCLGSDKVAQFDLANGQLTPKAGAPSVGMDAGAGPRHIDLHPNGQWAYVISEKAKTLSAMGVANGQLTHKQTLSTVPPGVTGGSTAEVLVHPAGHSVYGSNRGHNSIVHFRLDANGLMTLVGHTSTGGSTPRSFGLSPDGTLLLVANQDSNTIVAMRIDPATGALTPLGPVASVPGGPQYVGIVNLPQP